VDFDIIKRGVKPHVNREMGLLFYKLWTLPKASKKKKVKNIED
jgi:hypothetical protein